MRCSNLNELKTDSAYFLGVISLILHQLLACGTLVTTVLFDLRLFDCWMMPFGMRHHGNHLCLLPAFEVVKPSKSPSGHGE